MKIHPPASAPSSGNLETRHAPAGNIDLPAAIEALLLSAERPVSGSRLAAVLGLGPALDDDDSIVAASTPLSPSPAPDESPGEATADDTTKGGAVRRSRARRPPSPTERIRAAVAELNADYERSGRSFRVEEVAGGFRIMTLPRFGPLLDAFHGARDRSTLSRAAVETLAIVAYKQPITRAVLEAIRGVSCGEILRSLMERRLVTITGRAEELGRPILYGTTRQFLETFGLPSLKDLPTAQELRLRGHDEPEPPTQPVAQPQQQPATTPTLPA